MPDACTPAASGPGPAGGPGPAQTEGHQACRRQADGASEQRQLPRTRALLAVALSEHGAELLGRVLLGTHIQLRGRGRRTPAPPPRASDLGPKPGKGAEAGSAVTGGAGAGRQQGRRSQPRPGAITLCHPRLSPPPPSSEPCTPVSSDPNTVPAAEPGRLSENVHLHPPGATGTGLGGPRS